MRARRWVQVATLVALATTLAGCSSGPEYAATLNAGGHVQIEWCGDGDLLVVVGDSEVRVDYSRTSRPGISAVDLSAVPTDQWTPSPPTLRPESVIQVWPPARSTTTDVPLLTFRLSDLDGGRYLHQGRLISPDSWLAACQPDDGPLIPSSTLIFLAVVGLMCIASVMILIVWAIRAVLGTKSNGWRPPQPR